MNWLAFKLWVASWFRCQHFTFDLDQEEIVYRMPEYEDEWGVYEVWMCSCTCKCGKSGIE